MARPKKPVAEDEERSEPNPEIEERKRLKSLALSRNLLSNAPSKPISPLSPSNLVLKHQGRDIVKKGQRKNRFLFSFPGLLAPVSAGKIGELKDLGTKNPVLYIDFPQGRMKLFGTIVYPKNKYLTLQFARGGKNVTCEDCFENMVVFSDAWWIGKKDENPEEVQLEFPKQLDEGKHSDYDFKGGAGAVSVEKPTVSKPRKEYVESPSPDTELKDDVSDDSGLLTGKAENDAMETTPVRQSARTAGKVLKYAESSSEDNSAGSDPVISKMKEERDNENDATVDSSAAVSSPLGSDNEDTEVLGKVYQSSLSAKKSKEASDSKKGTLVQATLSSLFEKVTEKKSTSSVKKSPKPKGSVEKRKLNDSNQRSKRMKVGETSKKGEPKKRLKTGTKTGAWQKRTQVHDDDIEEISSDSQDANGSDEDWAA
ncbi:DNA-binding protein RHL1 isoform X1 [Cinnamomum micranthum f. kanehirae]|uniref:DNA-binding protein RHL1 isoform X1 n=1 Tax=Cinnamomum micranthum f. kanehirae TaxID=337451 RepID=A0A443PI39_9MAGN|nr:DNA-binding protein RHL1 isoform X1 [Cinnamomum micranthum f. kanehirae]